MDSNHTEHEINENSPSKTSADTQKQSHSCDSASGSREPFGVNVLETQAVQAYAGHPYSQSSELNNWQTQTAKEKPGNLFKPDLTDFAFALAVFILGYLFSSFVFFSWLGWGVSLFTTLYLLCISGYLIIKKRFVASPMTTFWLAVTWLIGMSYSLWSNNGFSGIRALFLLGSAVYTIMVASGSTLKAKTDNYLIVDGFNATILIPFRNFFNQYVSFSALAKGDKKGKILPVFLGIVTAIILAAIIIPLLETADAGGFGVVLNFFRDLLRVDFMVVIYIIVAIPVAAYIYGLVSGTAHKKGTDIIKPESAEKTVNALRVISPLTINTVLGVICVVYMVFIFSQLPYFFSAFTGVRPDGWLYYSEFARRGFFELCWIAAINLILLIAANLCNKKLRMESKVLKIFNIILASITLILIATAFSKMALYINVFGLTMLRLLPCIFMLFMVIVFVALIALQKWNFSIVKLSLIVGSIILVALCLSNPDAMVVRYNANRYMSGTLEQFDVEIARRAGFAGVQPTISVYRWTQDESLQDEIRRYISGQMHTFNNEDRSHISSFESIQAWNTAVRGGFLLNTNPSRMP
ncbi:MAG: DUF4173 domain-containing protein [Oscillospiraceae bacterium]|nr:DUF4173 domain-containing protein [Oscillospiraceae bacterium]